MNKQRGHADMTLLIQIFYWATGIVGAAMTGGGGYLVWIAARRLLA